MLTGCSNSKGMLAALTGLVIGLINCSIRLLSSRFFSSCRQYRSNSLLTIDVLDMCLYLAIRSRLCLRWMGMLKFINWYSMGAPNVSFANGGEVLEGVKLLLMLFAGCCGGN